MNDWIRMLALAPLAGALVANPVSAQDEEWSDDDALVVLDERLEGLDDLLDLTVNPTLGWLDDQCEDEDGCNVRVIVKDGKQLVIVDGDTVESDFPMPHAGAFAYRFGPHGNLGHRFRLDRDFAHDFRSFADPALRKLESEARTIARKARNAAGSERADLEKELDQKLNEIFDYKLELRDKSLKKAEEHVAEMKERFEKRKAARDEIIRNRKDELLGVDTYLEW